MNSHLQLQMFMFVYLVVYFIVLQYKDEYHLPDVKNNLKDELFECDQARDEVPLQLL